MTGTWDRVLIGGYGKYFTEKYISDYFEHRKSKNFSRVLQITHIMNIILRKLII